MKTIQQFLQRPWLYLIIVLIGISLKFYKVDNRFFWFDEICTILHVTGNEEWEIPINDIGDINTHYVNQLGLKSFTANLRQLL